ncbi:Aerobic glycerol-3-phosphate dehydrogenase [Corynebacterium faecale]|uniref:glycerol-3-phosphate dehydrogenase/oxidase n=1 Tax=Corynebacterium faecale TaxID=1758466 RepID=UPI0025B5469C|nr:glycerol-3-phosphate dehydrogenase/oxidase [Corynebacterium faecale]WJY92395.1 Aerobic glycerol-3-phosphate dehydrogenase [Corynebacterium faecale]
MRATLFDARRIGPPVRRDYDVIVIGGGISGVQIARHAVGRGLRTILFEARDFSSGTSSATSKMIHGGLRYLEQRDFAVVQEAIQERRYLGIAAPHLVSPRSFMLTAYDWSVPKAPVLGAGVALYEAMAWKRNLGLSPDNHSPRLRWVPRDMLLKAVPWLDPEGLKGAWRHDDTLNVHAERLLLGIVKEFAARGGTAINHAKVTRIERDESAGRVTGVQVHDQVTGGEARFRAPVVINAGGPWVAEALGDVAGLTGLRVRQSKGVHLLTGDLGSSVGVFVRGKNGRHVIVNPWLGRTLIGPTDTPIEGTADDAHADASDIDLLLETINSVRETPLDPAGIISTLVGVRPLVDDGSETYTSSRRFDIADHADVGLDGLISVSGGKWTTARMMGHKVIEHVVQNHSAVLPPVRSFDSRYQPLSTSFGDYETVGEAFQSAVRSHPDLPLGENIRIHLARLYGTEHERILDLVAAHPELARRLDPDGDCLDIAAQVVYAVTDEAAVDLADVLDRRIVLGTFRYVLPEVVRAAAGVMAAVSGWSDEDLRIQVNNYLNTQQAIQDVLAPYRQETMN